jgi:hypothetical protein
VLHIKNFPDCICSQVWYAELLKECKGCWNLFCAGLYLLTSFRNLKFFRLLLKFQTFLKEMGSRTFSVRIIYYFWLRLYLHKIWFQLSKIKGKNLKTTFFIFLFFLSRISLIWNPLLTKLKQSEERWTSVLWFMPFSII